MKKNHKSLFIAIFLAVLVVAALFIVNVGRTTKNSGTDAAEDGTASKSETENSSDTSDENSSEDTNGSEGKMLVVTSFYPMYIGAMNLLDGVEGIEYVNLTEPTTGCLHDYTLTTEDMKLLSTADVFVYNGGGIENFISDVVSAYPELTMVDTSSQVEALEDNAHYWMSVSNYMTQMEEMAEGIKAELSQGNYLSGDALDQAILLIDENLATYEGKLAGLQETEQEIADALADSENTNLVIFHEAYAYLAMDLGYNIVGDMDLDEERQVSASEVEEIISVLNENDPMPLVFADPVYGEDMGQTVSEETGCSVLYLDTLVQSNGEYEKNSYVEKMSENLSAILEALQ